MAVLSGALLSGKAAKMFAKHYERAETHKSNWQNSGGREALNYRGKGPGEKPSCRVGDKIE